MSRNNGSENKNEDLSEYLSITDVVRITGMRESKIRYHIKRGELKATKVGWQWIIKKEDLQEFLANKTEQGGDKK
jgi:excisionase family DNA binding protein